MRTSVFIILLATITPCIAGETDEIIQPLGLPKEDLKDVWHAGRCDPDWSVKVDHEVLKDKGLLGYKGLNSRFFQSAGTGDKVTLRAGMKCEALNKYYFQREPSIEIGKFISRDKRFVEKYGYSVIDAIYVEEIQFYNWNGNVGKFRLKHARELARKGLYTLKQKESEFNGKPSVAFSGERTAAGDRFHDNVFQ